MKSAVLPSFWKSYRRLSIEIRQSARKAYHLWAENPFHPSLRFKCINSQEGIWSVRITKGYRALGVLEGDTVSQTQMRPEDIREFTRRQPFEPYRIHLTGGQTYDVMHPDQVIVLRSRIIVGVGGENGVPEHAEHMALIHIVRIEELATQIQ